MMNDTTKKCNGKNTYTNKVCHTLWLGGSGNLVTLTSRVGEGSQRRDKQKNIFWRVVLLGRYSLGRGCPIGLPFKLEIQDFKIFTYHDETVTLHSILISYFTSKIFHFLFQQVKVSTQLLI